MDGFEACAWGLNLGGWIAEVGFELAGKDGRGGGRCDRSVCGFHGGSGRGGFCVMEWLWQLQI